MKNLLLLLLLLLILLTIPTLGQTLVKYQTFASRGNTQVMTGGAGSSNRAVGSFPSCTVTVYLTGTTTLASIYSDSSATPKSNPFTATSEGYVEFYARPNTYDLRFSGTGITTPFTRSGIKLTLDDSTTPTGIYNVVAYGAVGDALSITCSISASSSTLSCPAATFVSADTGKAVYVTGAGSNGAMLKTTGTYASATTLTLASTATTTVSSVTSYYGTDNTSYFQAAIDAANTAGGGEVYAPANDYILTYLTLAKKVTFKGAGLEATRIWSAFGNSTLSSTNGILRSIWPSDSSTAVNVAVRDMTIEALDTLSFQSCFHDNGGTYVQVQNVKMLNCHWGIIADQTELADFSHNIFETYNLSAYGGMRSTVDPTTSSYWTKTNSGSTTVNTSDGAWVINTLSTNFTTYYSRALNSSTLAKKGATIITKCPSVTASDGGALPNDSVMLTIDNASRAFYLRFTGSQVTVNGGTARTCPAGGNVRFQASPLFTSADLYVDGTLVEDDKAYTTSSGSARIAWGDFTSTDDSTTYWPDIYYFASSPLPASLWLVNGGDVTSGNDGDFTNRISVDNNQFNVAAVEVADDGGFAHTFRANNMNGGIYQYRFVSTRDSDISGGEQEGAILNPILIGRTTLQGSTTAGGNGAINIHGGNHINPGSVPGFPQIRLEQVETVTITGNNFTGSDSYTIEIFANDSGVKRVTAKGNAFTTTALLNSTTYDVIYDIDRDNYTDKEALASRQRISQLSLAVTTGTQITANQNNYSLPANGYLRISTDASRTITGLAAGRDGQVVYIVNVGSNDLVLAHQSSSSSAANRFLNSYALDITLSANLTAIAIYDSTTARWRVRLMD